MGCVLAILVCVGIIIPPPHLNIRWTIASVLLYPPDTVRVRDISSHIVREIIHISHVCDNYLVKDSLEEK